jgi:hypothetical protein
MFQVLFDHHLEALHIQQLAATTLLAASRHNTHKIYQLLYMQCLQMMNK